MTLYLVRHAKAGSRSDWKGDDEQRPLNKAGRHQAESIGRRLAKRDVSRLISSPFVRCVQTLEPLAHLLREPVHTEHRLSEGTDAATVMELFAALPDGVVMCSHGDVIPGAMEALQRRGCQFTSAPEWGKASVWVLQRDPDGSIVSAKAWPPPDA